MEKDRPKGEIPGETAPAEKKRKQPSLPLPVTRLKQPGELWPGELAAFPDPKSFVKHMAELVRNGAREQATEKPAAPAGEQPAAAAPEHTVFERVAELERKVAELEAKLAKYRQRRNAQNRRWREKNLEKAREQTRESVRASRARKRQGDS